MPLTDEQRASLLAEIADDPDGLGYLTAPLSATREQHIAKIASLGLTIEQRPYHKRRDHVYRTLRAPVHESGQTRTVMVDDVETQEPILWSRAEALGIALPEITEELCAALVAEAEA